MDVLILGAGAIGTLLAFRLTLAGHRVTAVGRASFVRAVQSRGLIIESAGRAGCVDRLIAVQDVRSIRDAGYKSHFDLLLITTRAFDTAIAAVQAQPFVQDGTQVMLIQDGVGGLEIARGILGEPALLAGVVTIPVETLRPGVIRLVDRRGGIGLAAADGQYAKNLRPALGADSLVNVFTQAGFHTRMVDDVRVLQWSRLLIAMLANAIPAILDWPLEQIYKNPRLYELELAALREAMQVVRRLGIRPVALPGYPVPLLVWWLTRFPATMTQEVFVRTFVQAHAGRSPSLRVELARRRKSEIEFLNGAIVREGKRTGVPTPVNQALTQIIQGIVQGEISWQEYRGQTDRLIERVRLENK